MQVMQLITTAAQQWSRCKVFTGQ